MPQYGVRCINGHREEYFVHSYLDRNCEAQICARCGHTMGPIIECSNRMLYFEEGRGRTMWNLGPEPVVVHSHRELEKKMKERGLDFAGTRRGDKGCW